MKCAECRSVVSFDKSVCETCGAKLPELIPSFQRAVEQYREQRRQFESGALSKAAFEAQLKKLMVKHNDRYWTIGATSGSWFRRGDRAWVTADPPVIKRSVVPQPPSGPASRKKKATDAPSKPVWISSLFDFNLKGLEFLPDSVTLVATSFDPDARVLHIAGSLWNSLRISEGKYLLDAMDSSGDGRFIFCVGIGRTGSGVWVWKTDTIGFGQQIAPWSKVYEASGLITSIASSYDGSRLAVGSSNGTVSVVEGVGGREVTRLKPGQGAVGRVAISGDGRYVAASGKIDPWIKLWETASSRELHEWPGGTANSLEFSRDGSHLLAAIRGSVITWNVPSGTDGARLTTNGVNYERAVFSRDGRRIVAAARSANESTSDLVMCETATAGDVRTIGKMDSTVECIAIPPGVSSFVACGGSDRRVHVLSM